MMGVAALTLSSCSQEDVLSVNASKDDNAISFRVRSAKQARSQEYSTANLKEFMVYGFKGDQDEILPGEEDPMVDYFEGGKPLLFSSNGSGLFTSSIPYYYPTDGSWLYFAAYAPASLPMKKAKYAGITLDDFTVDPDITKQIDIIVANGGSNLGKDDPDQELTFEHALTKVFVSRIINGDSRYKYEIAGIKFGNIANKGDFLYRGEKLVESDEDRENGVLFPDGWVNDPDGYCIFWKPSEEQNGDMVLFFDEPLVLDGDDVVYPMTGNDSGTEDNVGFQDGEGKGGFMLIPQKLSKDYVNEDGTLEGKEFGDGMSYIAFLVRITYKLTGDLVYPYAEGVGNITETIGEGDDAVAYAWAAFPVSTLWRPSTYVDYAITLTNGAGYVAPGADPDVVYQPILGREIKFTEDVHFWPNYTDSSHDQNNEITGDGTNVDDSFFDDPFGD